MLILLTMLCFSDITINADGGHWIDYARSGRLSENRIMVIQHVGTKGQYKLGPGRVQIYNNDGCKLYEIPNAGDAWTVKNDLLGDEDLFLYQLRTDSTFYFWHPQYGTKPLERPSHPNENLGRQGLVYYKTSEDGKRIFFACKYQRLSRPEDRAPDDTVRITEIEEVQFKTSNAAQLFAQEEITINYHNEIFNNTLEVNPARQGFVITDPYRNLPVYWYYDITTADAFVTPVKREIPYNIITAYEDDGFIAILTTLDSRMQKVLLDLNCREVFRRPPRGADDSDVDRELDYLWSAFNKGVVTRNNQELSYISHEALVRVDLQARTITRYNHNYGPRRPTQVSTTELMEVDDQSLRLFDINNQSLTESQPSAVFNF